MIKRLHFRLGSMTDEMINFLREGWRHLLELLEESDCREPDRLRARPN